MSNEKQNNSISHAGTFRASDTINTLREFIRENINVGWAVYNLKTPLGESIDDDGETLLSYKLVSCI